MQRPFKTRCLPFTSRATCAFLPLLLTGLIAGHVVAQSQFVRDGNHRTRFTPPLTNTYMVGAPLPGDFTGDGRTDFIVSSYIGLRLYVNQGGGEYVGDWVAVGYYPVAAMWARDLDGDGDLDVVVPEATGFVVYANDGAGGLTELPREPVPAQGRPGSADFADIDGDGDLDMVLAYGSQIAVVETLALGSYAVTVLRADSYDPRGIAVTFGDFDGDGDPDIASNWFAAGGGYEIFENDGAGRFPTLLTTFSLPRILDMVAADYDGDGDQDILAVGESATPVMIAENRSGSFVDSSANSPTTTTSLRNSMAAADFDQDGDIDIVTAGGPETVQFLLNNGSGAFLLATQSRWAGPSFGWGPLHVFDIDDDGDLDLAYDGAFATFALNHLRQLASVVVPRIGGSFDLDIYSGPNFAAPALTPVAVAIGLQPSPIRIPGIEGVLELDQSAVVIALPINSILGRSRVRLAIPNNPALVGFEVHFQGGVLPTGPTGPAAFTNVITDVISL